MAADTFPKIFELEIRVYYEDTDAAGVVYYANYLKFLERGRTEWLRRLGLDQSELAESQGRMFVVRHAETSYLRPARLDDMITVHTQIALLRRASIHFEQWVTRGEELLCRGTTQVCCVDVDGFRPAPLGDELRTLLEKVQS